MTTSSDPKIIITYNLSFQFYRSLLFLLVTVGDEIKNFISETALINHEQYDLILDELNELINNFYDFVDKIAEFENTFAENGLNDIVIHSRLIKAKECKEKKVTEYLTDLIHYVYQIIIEIDGSHLDKLTKQFLEVHKNLIKLRYEISKEENQNG